MIQKCDCGCGVLELQEDGLEDYWFLTVNYYPLGFYVKQDGIFKTIKNRLILAAKILMGKEFSLFEITICNEDSIRKFKDQLREFANG